MPVRVPCVIWLTDWPGVHRLKDDIKQYDLLCGCSRIMNVPWRAEVEGGGTSEEDKDDVFFHLCLVQEIQCNLPVNNRANHVLDYSGVFARMLLL